MGRTTESTRLFNPLDVTIAGVSLGGQRPLQPTGMQQLSRRSPQKGVDKVTFLWILLAIIYVACWIYFGMATFRKGHYWMFWIGFFFPILWIIGAFIGPTPRAAGVV